MISQLEKEVSLRYLKTRKKEGFLNIISIFSFIGISLGVAVLIIVISVMNGFRSELVDKIIGFNAHAVVKPYENPINSNIFSNKKLRLISKKLVLSNSGEGVIINRDYTKGILLRGYGQKSFKRLKLAQNNTKIIGYGSPAKATTALNFFGISNEIEYIVEDNKLKQGKFLPGMKIPIVSKKSLKEKPDYALVLAWNFFDEIKKRNSDLAHKLLSIKDLEV